MPRDRDIPSRRPARRASPAGVAVVALLLLGTLVAGALAHRQSERTARTDQTVLAERATTIAAARLRMTVGRLEDLAALVELAPSLDERAFSARAASVMRDPAFAGVSLVEVVPRARRAAWEQANGPILSRVFSGARLAPDRSTLFVLTRVAERGGTPPRLDYDMGEDRATGSALTMAWLTGLPQMTAPGRREAGAPMRVGLYVRVAGRQRLAGADLDVGRLRDGLRMVLPADVRLRVTDEGRPVTSVGAAPSDVVSRRVRVVGRTWTITVGRRDLGLDAAVPTLLLGLALTLLVGALVVQAARRERYALALVDERLAERDSSEAAREAAELRFEAAFEESPIGMQLVTVDGRIERVNHAMVHITGYPREQLQRMRATELLHPDDRARDLEGADRLLRGELEVATGDRRCLHALGDVVWVSVNATLLRASEHDEPKLLVQVQDITERRRYEAQLQYLADHDPLTGLVNRRAFEREVHRHLVHNERYGPQGAVVVLDIDDFKSVNDTLGHSEGDSLIIEVGHTLSARLRESDVLARLGGDEFAVLLPRVDGSDALTVTQDLLQGIRGMRVRRGDGRQRSVSSSAGVALLGVGEAPARTVDEVLVQADVAMYEAKEAGGDQAALHRPEQPGEAPRMLARITWADRIRTALEEDRFVLHAQPIVDLISGETTQHELLLRMLDADGEIIPPGSFLHVAERVGLMPAIDRWVVRRAVELLAERPELVLEVNLSGASTGDAEVLRLIETGLRTHRVDASRLIFEVTETVAISNIPRAQHFATRLAELGCRFALDDFGAGFGSFYYLKHLPFDVLKIDGEFVRHCTTNPTDQVLIKAVVDIARGLGKRTVAEHVGDEETVALLRELGIDLGQGFHLGRPAPLEAGLAQDASRS